MSKELTDKQRLFVREYLVDRNATRAAVSVGYSQKTADQQGSRLLKNVKIAKEIERLTASRIARLDIKADRILEGLAKLAFFDPRDFYNEDGSLKSLPDMDANAAFAISGVEVEKLYKHYAKGAAEEVGTVSKVKFADRGLNLERLGRHLKLFTEKLELSGSVTLSERLARAQATINAEASA